MLKGVFKYYISRNILEIYLLKYLIQSYQFCHMPSLGGNGSGGWVYYWVTGGWVLWVIWSMSLNNPFFFWRLPLVIKTINENITKFGMLLTYVTDVIWFLKQNLNLINIWILFKDHTFNVNTAKEHFGCKQTTKFISIEYIEKISNLQLIQF